MQKETDPFSKENQERFWRFVQRTESCWIWKRATTGKGYEKGLGYGIFTPVRPFRFSAHRYSWIIHNGAIPNGLCVLHKCDVRPCCNPDHLFLGTALDNTTDMISKGRMPRGMERDFAKLNDKLVKYIREERMKGTKGVMLAKRLGVSPAAICLANNGVTWSHVHGTT